jgi:UDPglucose 6-dehydrogenase
VLGGIDEKSIDMLDELYTGFDGVERIRTNNTTAETIKYASNALQAMLISFSNEIGNLCAAVGNTDVVDVMRGVHACRYLTTVLPNGDRIVAPIVSFLAAGCGFGGSCFPKDVKALIAFGEKYDKPMSLLNAVIEINKQQPRQILNLLQKHFPSPAGLRIAILGLAFRPDTNDMRESPAIPIINDLLDLGAEIVAYDPIANQEAAQIFGTKNVKFSDSLEEAIENVEAVVLVTRWSEFQIVPELLARLNPQPLLIDGRRMLDKNRFTKYEGIGL